MKPEGFDYVPQDRDRFEPGGGETGVYYTEDGKLIPQTGGWRNHYVMGSNTAILEGRRWYCKHVDGKRFECEPVLIRKDQIHGYYNMPPGVAGMYWGCPECRQVYIDMEEIQHGD